MLNEVKTEAARLLETAIKKKASGTRREMIAV